MPSNGKLELHNKPAPQTVLAGAGVFLGAFLLFTLEPLVAKILLPWFGGSAAVWTTCLVFYQTALLAGYWYARLLTRRLPQRGQAIVHSSLLVVSLLLLPVGPSGYWKQGSVQDSPALHILLVLACTIGLPFLLLSATSSLTQEWLARGGHEKPYKFFALSNLASLAALVAYPLVIEPNLDMPLQRQVWSACYAAYAVVLAAMAFRTKTAIVEAAVPSPAPVEAAPVLRPLHWFVLAACGSMLLLSVTNHITQNVAAVPLLWVLPLAVYLTTFILGFASDKWYRGPMWLRALAFALGVLGYAVYSIDSIEAIQVGLPIFLGGLFVCCLFCHAELYARRPAASQLTGYYLQIAAGGAVGAIFIGLCAPLLFRGIYELPFTLVVTALLALWLSWEGSQWPQRILWGGVSAAMVAVFLANVNAYNSGSLVLRRSFYGSLRVAESHVGPNQTRTLYHGTIEHGTELMWADQRLRPIAYYGRDSGISIALRECVDSPRRVGIVGLGAGTIAGFGHAGDTFRFYELNHQVVDIANIYFFFTRLSPAKVEIVEGDARLSMERETEPFDLLALDAFSGDAIPVHLITREAMAVYTRLLKPNGIIAVHVSNSYLELAPIVKQLADEAGYQSAKIHNHKDDSDHILEADWVLITKNPAVLANAAVRLHAQDIASRAGMRPWTDSFNNLLEVIKWPSAGDRNKW